MHIITSVVFKAKMLMEFFTDQTVAGRFKLCAGLIPNSWEKKCPFF